MGLTIRDLPGDVGVVVDGLDLTSPASPEDASALRTLWDQHGLLLFRGQEAQMADQIRLSQLFGELAIHPAREGWVDGHPELTVIQYDPSQRPNSSIYDVDGRELANWLPWHIDLIYTTKVTRAGCLRAIRIPDSPANTGFIDRAKLLDRLEPDLRAALDGRRFVYRLNPMATTHPYFPTTARMTHIPDRISALAARIETDFPPVSHPAVMRHPSGRDVLNYSPIFVTGIEGMSREEAAPLLHRLTGHVLASTGRYYHAWRQGDIVLWDNWRMLHSAEGTPTDGIRQLHRTTVLGDYDLGRLAEPADGGVTVH